MCHFMSRAGTGFCRAGPRAEKRRGKLWEGVLFVFIPSTYRKEKLKQNTKQRTVTYSWSDFLLHCRPVGVAFPYLMDGEDRATQR